MARQISSQIDQGCSQHFFFLGISYGPLPVLKFSPYLQHMKSFFLVPVMALPGQLWLYQV